MCRWLIRALGLPITIGAVIVVCWFGAQTARADEALDEGTLNTETQSEQPDPDADAEQTNTVQSLEMQQPAQAPGSLDPSFGTGGSVFTQTSTDSPPQSQANDVTLQADGKVVAAGSSKDAAGNDEMVVARYAADGTLDPTFGTGGIVRTKGGVSPGSPVSRAHGVRYQPDGKIVAAGTTLSAQQGYTDEFVVVRYMPDGSLDTGFGTGGIVRIQAGQFATPSSGAFGMILQPDGKIVAVGAANDTTDISLVALVRYMPDGSLDTGFGTGGIVRTQVGQASEKGSLGSRGVLQPDGKIVVAAQTIDIYGEAQRMAVVRYMPDGSLDTTTFGTGGIVRTQAGSPAAPTSGASDVAVQPDGKIVLAGATWNTFQIVDVALVRYMPDGSLDTTFGTGGIVRGPGGGPPGGGAEGKAIAIQADGKIVVGGDTAPLFGQPKTGAVFRYLPDGSLDTSFGTGGTQITPPPPAASPAGVIYGVVLQPNGKIVAAGVGYDASTRGFFELALYRLFGIGDAKLTITKAVTPSSVVTGQTATFTLTVTNVGSEVGLLPLVTDDVPPEVVDVTVTTLPAGWTDNSVGNHLDFSADMLAAGETAVFVYTGVVVADPGARITNTATVTWANNDGGSDTSPPVVVEVTAAPEPTLAALPFTGGPPVLAWALAALALIVFGSAPALAGAYRPLSHATVAAKPTSSAVRSHHPGRDSASGGSSAGSDGIIGTWPT